jgi:hypothetical protein
VRAFFLMVAALAVLLGLAGSSSGAGGTDWKNLKYMLYDIQDELITTDGSWENAKVVTPLQPGERPPNAPPPYDTRLKVARIWGQTCLNGRQTVSMTKTFQAPGHAFSGNLYLDPTFGFPRPIHGVSVLVNGRQIGRLGDISSGKTAQSISAPLSPEALTALHYGLNKLTIRVDKNALPKGEACNTKNRLIGIVAMLSLRFEPDLEAIASDKGRMQAVRSSAGSVVGALGAIRFVNNGPSGSAGGKLIFRIQGSSFVETAWTPTTLQVGPPFHDCVGEGTGIAVQGIITCQYSDFPAGLRDSIGVIAAGRLTPNFPPSSTTRMDVDWQIIPAGYETNAANNSFSHEFLICGPTAKDPACANTK